MLAEAPVVKDGVVSDVVLADAPDESEAELELVDVSLADAPTESEAVGKALALAEAPVVSEGVGLAVTLEDAPGEREPVMLAEAPDVIETVG